MKVIFQFNQTELSIDDFTDKDIPKVEQYFSNPFYKGFPYKDFYEYVNELKQYKRTHGYFKSSTFQPGINIYLSTEQDY